MPRVDLDTRFICFVRLLVRSTSRCVVVLQTGSHPIAVPYFSDGALVHLNPRTPTRHVVAGVASALGGVGAPYQRFDVAKRRSVNTFLWANGFDAPTARWGCARVSGACLDGSALLQGAAC